MTNILQKQFSLTVTLLHCNLVEMDAERYPITELTERVNAWCQQHHVEPLHNGAGLKVTVRNIRYYQSLGLVDRPLSAGGRGFTEKHRLQLIAIRLLQARGLPLGKIQSLLYGRNEEELREVEARGVAELDSTSNASVRMNTQDWKMTPITADILVLTRSARELTAAQRLRIQEIIEEESAKIEEADGMGLESFRPETD